MRRDLALALALVGALMTAYVFGCCAEKRGAEIHAWQDSTAVAHRTAREATEAFRREQLATAAVARSLDSALAAWDSAASRVRVVGVPGPATVVPGSTDPLYAPGVTLARSCTAYRSACELAMEKADSAITALRDENDLLRRRPGDPGARRLQPWVALGVDPLARVPGVRGGVDLRLFSDWIVTADVNWRLAPGDSARLWVGLKRAF